MLPVHVLSPKESAKEQVQSNVSAYICVTGVIPFDHISLWSGSLHVQVAKALRRWPLCISPNTQSVNFYSPQSMPFCHSSSQEKEPLQERTNSWYLHLPIHVVVASLYDFKSELFSTLSFILRFWTTLLTSFHFSHFSPRHSVSVNTPHILLSLNIALCLFISLK